MKTFYFIILIKKFYDNISINKEILGLQSSLLLSGLNFFQVHKRTKIQFLEKIKFNSEIYLLRIIKTLLLYHLKQTS